MNKKKLLISYLWATLGRWTYNMEHGNSIETLNTPTEFYNETLDMVLTCGCKDLSYAIHKYETVLEDFESLKRYYMDCAEIDTHMMDEIKYKLEALDNLL